MKSKKFILFVVEGITDQTSLGIVLDQLLSNGEVRFAITGGDITTKNGSRADNIIAKLGNIVREFCGSIFKASDFMEVVHLVDMDGAYISPEDIVYADHEKTSYQEEEIETKHVKELKQRNIQKSEILNRLVSLEKIWRSVPYSVYYFSCNLDHVLHGNANLTRTEKIEFARNFEDRFLDQPQQFKEFLSKSDFSVNGSYQESWEFIKLDTNSLQQFTNFNLYINKNQEL